MIALAVSLVAVAGFALAFVKLRVLAVLQGALGTTAAGITAMTDSALDDDAKEAAVRKAGFALVGASLGIIWRFAVAIGIAAAVILGADALGLASSAEVFALMLRLDYIIGVSVAAMVVTAVLKKLRGNVEQTPSSGPSYAPAERMLHALAFSGPRVLKAISRLEDRLFGAPKPLEQAPIFVTSLARGGTTAVLNAMHETNGLATHTYRDMPFLTAPSLGNRLAGGSKRAVTKTERAHGDGMTIDLNSAEAFEEVIWKMFWPKRFSGKSIPLWSAEDRSEEAESFLSRHMAKIARARGLENARYCSKNNANIARIPYLKAAFPEAKIVVPLRRPETHAASLLRQHLNFLTRHDDDTFVQRYMSDIGHYEFGALHKPLAFEGFDPAAHDTQSPDYWLAYWIAANRAVLAQADACEIVLQDDLRAAPQETMGKLYAALDVDAGTQDFTQYFHAKPDVTDTSVFDAALLAEAAELYDQLVAHACRPDASNVGETARPAA